MAIDPRTVVVGQTLIVKELPFGVLLEPPADGEAAVTVVAIDREQIVLDDPANESRRTIPLYLVHKSAPVLVEKPDAA